MFSSWFSSSLSRCFLADSALIFFSYHSWNSSISYMPFVDFSFNLFITKLVNTYIFSHTFCVNLFHSSAFWLFYSNFLFPFVLRLSTYDCHLHENYHFLPTCPIVCLIARFFIQLNMRFAHLLSRGSFWVRRLKLWGAWWSQWWEGRKFIDFFCCWWTPWDEH